MTHDPERPPGPAPGSAPVSGRARDIVIGLDRAILALARHWLVALVIFVTVFVGLPFLAPILMNANLPGPARAVYGMYGGLCHQLGYRSWYLFGEQAAYPRTVFQQYSGIDPDDIWASRAFVGNRQMGYKVAYCQRDIAIYGAIAVAGLVFMIPAVRERARPLPWLAYGLIGIAPIALDGFSQLFSQFPYNSLNVFGWLPYRESTPELRTLTGGLFGLANAWLAFPYIRQSMAEIERELSAKLARAGITTR
jgi:uncharacterized membrane protein